MQQNSPGQVVLLKGLPGMTEQRSERLLSRSYSLSRIELVMPSSSGHRSNKSNSPSDTSIVGATVKLRNLTPTTATSSFMVRLETVSDAMRLVRKWHRQPWESTGRLQSREEKHADLDYEEVSRG
jgi:hypothetical protein